MEKYSGYNDAVILFAALGSWLSGYGQAVIIATVGQPSLYASLNLDPDPTSPGYSHTDTIVATVQGIFFAGGFFGRLFAGMANNKLRRLAGFRICAAVFTSEDAIQTGATNQAMVVLEGSGFWEIVLMTADNSSAPPDLATLLPGSSLDSMQGAGYESAFNSRESAAYSNRSDTSDPLLVRPMP